MKRLVAVLSLALCTTAASCSELPKQPTVGVGPNPQLPPPERSLIPTVDIAPAQGWPQGKTPTAAPGRITRAPVVSDRVPGAPEPGGSPRVVRPDRHLEAPE